MTQQGSPLDEMVRTIEPPPGADPNLPHPVLYYFAVAFNIFLAVFIIYFVYRTIRDWSAKA